MVIKGRLVIFFKAVREHLRKKYGLEIDSPHIGRGLYLGHPYNITVSPYAIIGDNCNLHKGVTVGRENRGERKGAPVIGDKVWIGINATVVGNIKIGNDVMIAPNSFVNCDIPDHSIVIGNSCCIHRKDNATEGYINRVV
ncbi:MAG: serine acetyltransferase [Oscillospiraceae bacterium]|nr:serine acetyltransferase [Oscillospiraceae bacterium]